MICIRYTVSEEESKEITNMLNYFTHSCKGLEKYLSGDLTRMQINTEKYTKLVEAEIIFTLQKNYIVGFNNLNATHAILDLIVSQIGKWISLKEQTPKLVLDSKYLLELMDRLSIHIDKISTVLNERQVILPD